jgi:hypothetical protein
MTQSASSAPSSAVQGRVLGTLKDGYWDQSEVVQLADGSLRVRKTSKGDAPPGPWGVGALRREIEYLTTLSPVARYAFPPVLSSWDDSDTDPPRVGYEMPFYVDHVDVGELARRGALAQGEIDSIQDATAELLLEHVHLEPPMTRSSLAAHVRSVVESALRALEVDSALGVLVGAQAVRINGAAGMGPRVAFARICEQDSVLAALDAEPQVRLHGDLFLENLLWRSAGHTSAGATPRLLLIDPVSVAGVDSGPPWFDLVKYESYATGELPALRSEWVNVAGFEDGRDYCYEVRWQDPALRPYRAFDWHSRVRQAFAVKYGAIDSRLCRLIDGYFSVAMAVNTSGIQRRARLLKATLDFNAVLQG